MDQFIFIIIIIFILFLCFKNVEGLTSGPVEKVCGCDEHDHDVQIFREKYDENDIPIYPPLGKRTCKTLNNYCDQEDLDKCYKDAKNKLNSCMGAEPKIFKKCLNENNLERERCNENYCPLSGALIKKCSSFRKDQCPRDRSKGQPCSLVCPESHPNERPNEESDNKCYRYCPKTDLTDGSKCSDYTKLVKGEDAIEDAENTCTSKTYLRRSGNMGNILKCKSDRRRVPTKQWWNSYTKVVCEPESELPESPDCMFLK